MQLWAMMCWVSGSSLGEEGSGRGPYFKRRALPVQRSWGRREWHAFISSQGACVLCGAQRPKGLVEAGGVARPPRTWGPCSDCWFYSKENRNPLKWSDMMELWFENNKNQLQYTYPVWETLKVLCKYRLTESSQSKYCYYSHFTFEETGVKKVK